MTYTVKIYWVFYIQEDSLLMDLTYTISPSLVVLMREYITITGVFNSEIWGRCSKLSKLVLAQFLRKYVTLELFKSFPEV
jgi:hypothetical protein